MFPIFLKSIILPLILVVVLHVQSNFGKCDYYWRDFDGTVPTDAYKIINRNDSGLLTYIGNAVGYQGFTYVGMVLDGSRDITATHGDPITQNPTTPQKYTKLMKILCAPKSSTPTLDEVLINNDADATAFFKNYEQVRGGAELHTSSGTSFIVPLYVGFTKSADHESYIGQVSTRGNLKNQLVCVEGNAHALNISSGFYMLGCKLTK